MANKFLTNINLTAGLEADGDSGSAGQVLSSTGTGVEWIDQSASNEGADLVYFEVKNSTGSTLSKGTGVMAVGTDGNSGHILINAMVGDGSVEPKYFLGVLEEDLSNGNTGRVISFGMIDQFNTNGQNGETWSDGDILWCDPVNAGDFTITEPDGPNLKIAAAIVLNAATNGKIQVRVQANEGIHDLHDTKITSQVDGDVLVWDNTTGVWFNDSTLNVDYTNSRVGIGTTSPERALDVEGTIQGSNYLFLQHETNSDFGIKVGRKRTNNGVAYLDLISAPDPIAGDHQFRIFRNSGDNGITDIIHKGTGSLVFDNVNNADTIFSNGNVGIGTTSPGYKLDVSAAARAHGVRIGRDFSIANRGTVRIDANGIGSPSDVLFGHTAAANESGWNGVYWSLSSRGTEDNGKFQLWRGSGHAAPYNSELRVLTALPNGNIGIGTTDPSEKLNVSGNILATGTILGSNLSGTNTGDQDLSVYYTKTESDSRFVNVTGDTMTGTLTIDTGGDSSNALVIKGTSPTISLLDDDGGDDFYLHVNSNNFYVLVNRDANDIVGTGWEGPHPLLLEGDTNVGYLFGNRMFADNYHPNADVWTTARTITIGNTSKSVNGSANVSWSLAEIGAQPAGDYLPLTGGELTGTLRMRDGNVIELRTSSNSTRGYIQATETNDAHLIIATSNGEDISFRDGGVGGQWNMIIRGDGQTLINSRIDSPIYYDLNNTGYYLNPAGTSRLGYAHFDGYDDASGNARTSTGVSLGRYTSDFAHIDIASSNSNGGWIDFSSASGGDYGGRIRYHNGSDYMSFYAGGANEEFRINSTYTTSLGSSRAPIFYDSNNTGYYLNPASTSNLLGLTVNNTISGTTNGNVKQLNTSSGNIDDDWGTSFKTFDPIPSGTPPLQSPNVRTINIGESFARRTQLAFDYATDRAFFRRRQDTTWHDWREFYHTGNFNPSSYLTTSGKAADSNLLDGINSTSFLRSDVDDSVNAGVTYTWNNTNDAGIIFTNSTYGTQLALGGWTTSNTNNLSRIRTSSGNLHMDSAANGAMYLNWYSGGDVKTNRLFQSEASVRAPIFYDSNNTGYYLDPSSTSVMVRANLDYIGIGTSSNTSGFYRLNMGGYIDMNNNGIDYLTQLHFNDNVRFLDNGNNSEILYRAGNTSASKITLQTSTTTRGSIYADSTNSIGLLDQGGSWGIKHVNDNGTYFYTDGTTEEFRVGRDAVTGNYGTVQTSTTRAGWGGYSINGQYVLMSDHGTNVGLYNDIDNEWMFLASRNGGMEFMYNGSTQGSTQNGYFLANNQMRSPIYYDSNNTAYYLDPSSTGTSIKVAGNVGIGTTNPGAKLHVQNYTTGESHQAMFKGGAVTTGDYSYISLNNGYSTEYNKEIRLAAVAESGASNTTGFAILTSPDSAGASGHERLRVTAGGNVGIGTTSPSARLHVVTESGSNKIGARFDPASTSSNYGTSNIFIENPDYGYGAVFNRSGSYDNIACQFRYQGSAKGSISINTTSTSFNTSSDYRLKENIVDITTAIDRINLLNPVRFNFIENPDETVDGFIAHEVADVIPEAVTGEKDAVDPEGNPVYQGIDQAKIVPLLTAALQDAIAKIEQLETRMQTLENNN